MNSLKKFTLRAMPELKWLEKLTSETLLNVDLISAAAPGLQVHRNKF